MKRNISKKLKKNNLRKKSSKSRHFRKMLRSKTVKQNRSGMGHEVPALPRIPRGQGLITIPRIDFSGKLLSESGMQKKVAELKPGPNIIRNIVIPHKEESNQRHAFLVDIQDDAIMISDWNGPDNVDSSESAWQQYVIFMRLLPESEIGRVKPIRFYDVDEEIETECATYHNRNGEGHQGHGGCSRYIFAWINRHQDLFPGYDCSN